MAKNKKQRRPAFAFNPISAAIAMAMAPGASWAQSAEDPPAAVAAEPESAPAATEAEELSPLTVEGKKIDGEFTPFGASMKPPMALRDIPQSVTVITRPVMDSQAAASVKDALRYVPGITISAGEGGQIGDNFNLRGFSARTDVYLDGFRDRGQYSRDLFFLEAVEVLKGPSSMLFGRGSTGGVINQVTKQPLREQRSEVATTLGGDEYYRVTGDFNAPLGEETAMRLAVMAQDLGSTRDVVTNQDYGFAPSLRLGMGSDFDLTVYGLAVKNDDVPDYGFPLLTENGPGTVATPIAAPANRFYGYADDRFIQEVASLGATLTVQLTPALQLRQRVQRAAYSTDASPSPLTVPSGPATPTQQMSLDSINLQRQDRDREVRDTSLFGQTDLIARFTTGAVAHTLTGGAEVGEDRFRNDAYSYDRTGEPTDSTLINLGDPVHGTRTGVRYQSAKTRTDASTLAAYVNEQLEFDEQWQAVLGVRWDRFEADSSVVNYDAAGTPTVPAQPAPKTERTWSPRAGLIWQPGESQSYYLSYGTSFNPTAEAVTQSSGTTAANASLEPEQNRSYELGAKWTLVEGSLELSSALFRVDKTNARYNDPALGGLQSNEGEARVEGFEVGVVGRITDRWQLVGGYTWLDSEIVASPEIGTGNNAGIAAQGKRFPNTPEHAATLWNAWRLPGGWEAGAGAVYVGERTLNNFETARTDAYTRGDAMLGFSRPSFDLRLNLLNVTDELYFDTALGGRATPARGRTALLTGTMRFGG